MPPDLLTPIPPPAPLQETLKQWSSWGAVVDHFIFPVAGEIVIGTHYQAACSGLVKAVHKKEKNRWNGAIDWNQLTIDTRGNWTIQEFFGWQFEVKTRTLFLRGDADNHLNSYFAPEEHENDGEARFKGFFNQELESGYAYAMVDPPDNLFTSNFFGSKRVSNQQKLRGFSRLCDGLWGDLDSLQIYGWPTICSNYFDDSQGWWRSCFWTVYSPTHNWVVSILASAMD